MFTAENWPIGANMLSFGSTTPDGTPTLEAPSTVWASQLRQVKELGVDQIDPTDAWLPLAKLTGPCLHWIRWLLHGVGMSPASVSMTCNALVHSANAQQYLRAAPRFIGFAPSFGVSVVKTCFMQATTEAQNKA